MNMALVEVAGHYVQPFVIEGLGRLDKVVDGGLDADTLQMSDGSEALFLHDSISEFHQDEALTLQTDFRGEESTARLTNIETIKAGGGSDLIDMTSNEYNYDVGLTAYGEAGNDTIWATKLDDTIHGGDGNDTIFGGDGNDALYGGAGADTFEFAVNSGSDTIYDFNLTEDSLVFYARQSYASVDDAGSEGLSLNNGNLTWENISVNLNDTGLNDLDQLDIEFQYI